MDMTDIVIEYITQSVGFERLEAAGFLMLHPDTWNNSPIDWDRVMASVPQDRINELMSELFFEMKKKMH